jgi:hypothetical protein
MSVTPADGAGTHPLFIYAVGTGVLVSSQEADLAAREMAARGFVAIVLDYESSAGFDCAAMRAKTDCAYGARPASATTIACAMPDVDCNKGIVVAGLSQGANIAVLARNYDPRVRAAWLMSFGGGASGTLSTGCYPDSETALPATALRVINGRYGQLQPLANLQLATGTSCGPWSSTCLRPDGSGWVLVENAQVEDGHADHCYFVGPDANGAEVGCSTKALDFDHGWKPPASAPWSLTTNLDWLAQFAD